LYGLRVGLEFRHFERGEDLACFDGIAFVHGERGDVAGNFGVQYGLLPRCKRGGQGDPAVNKAGCGLYDGEFEGEAWRANNEGKEPRAKGKGHAVRWWSVVRPAIRFAGHFRR
jgi:hypothetical protein